ncbi:hypothetical protein D3C86_1210990 [compost metagenome]
MIPVRTEQVIDVGDWDDLVSITYGKPYNFQQQDGCKERQREYLKIPDTSYDFENDTVPEVVNHEEMGVSFKAWLDRDPNQKIPEKYPELDFTKLWWERNFYPDVQMIANDLHAKGLIEAGDYVIDIDW